MPFDSSGVWLPSPLFTIHSGPSPLKLSRSMSLMVFFLCLRKEGRPVSLPLVYLGNGFSYRSVGTTACVEVRTGHYSRGRRGKPALSPRSSREPRKGNSQFGATGTSCGDVSRSLNPEVISAVVTYFLVAKAIGRRRDTGNRGSQRSHALDTRQIPVREEIGRAHV